MDQQKKMIEGLRKSLQISVILNVVAVIALFFVVALRDTIGFPSWNPSSWWPEIAGPNPYEPAPRSEPDSNTLALARQLSVWIAPDINSIPESDSSELIKYGHALISKTAAYLGPKGQVMQITNGLNCQNCHLDAGTRPWGNNYGAVASTYPKFRERSGSIETIPKRVNDCLERSLNGQALPEDNRELKAMVAYIEWLGKDVPKKEVPNGSGIYSVPFLSRAASPAKGKTVYEQKCASCHGKDGLGVAAADGTYTYPPLWGPESYNSGAGLFRLSRFAGYVKYNMPFGVTYQNPQLSDEECWDVAAYVNSQPRPSKDLSGDWPNLLGKPVDHPFGPYDDGFSEAQHKFGPFGPVRDKIKELKQAKAK
jgi:thiosulfate dehydrogenase